MRTSFLPTAAFLFLLQLRGQNVSGSIKGSLLDPSSSPVPLAELTLTNTSTGASTKALSNATGLFVFANVLAGSGEIRELGNLNLQFGEVKETVTINDTPPTLQLASGEKSGLVSGDQMNEIALKGRDFFAHVSLLPGVVDDGSVSSETASHSVFAGISINGGRSDNKNFTVDGIGALDNGSNNSLHSEPNMDSISAARKFRLR